MTTNEPCSQRPSLCVVRTSAQFPLARKSLIYCLASSRILLGYFKTNERLKAIREERPDALERAVGELANSDEQPAEAAETFLKAAWPLLVKGTQNNKPYGESRILATVIQALTRPKTAISVIYQKYHNLGQALLGRPLFGNNPLTADEYRRIPQLANQILAIMRDEWGWRPRDLWDVQGFIWVTCGQKLEDEGEMTDEDLLRRFDGDVRFREARAAWQDDQKIAFCRIARAVHEVGLDSYHTPSYPVRFGRKFKGNQEASGTLPLSTLRMAFPKSGSAINIISSILMALLILMSRVLMLSRQR